jgi:cytochrome P450
MVIDLISTITQTAVIKESLRMAHGVVTPLPRIVGPTDAEISGFIVPAGVRISCFYKSVVYSLTDDLIQTVVSMGATILHKNGDIFPDPLTFQPERWLKEDSTELEKYLVAFSKGPRSCLGIK